MESLESLERPERASQMKKQRMTIGAGQSIIGRLSRRPERAAHCLSSLPVRAACAPDNHWPAWRRPRGPRVNKQNTPRRAIHHRASPLAALGPAGRGAGGARAPVGAPAARSVHSTLWPADGARSAGQLTGGRSAGALLLAPPAAARWQLAARRAGRARALPPAGQSSDRAINLVLYLGDYLPPATTGCAAAAGVHLGPAQSGDKAAARAHKSSRPARSPAPVGPTAARPSDLRGRPTGGRGRGRPGGAGSARQPAARAATARSQRAACAHLLARELTAQQTGDPADCPAEWASSERSSSTPVGRAVCAWRGRRRRRPWRASATDLCAAAVGRTSAGSFGARRPGERQAAGLQRLAVAAVEWFSRSRAR